jgi:hypothetical protein
MSDPTLFSGCRLLNHVASIAVQSIVSVLFRSLNSESSPTLVFCGEWRHDSTILPADERLPRLNASRFQFGANCKHVVKLKRVAMQPWWKCVAKFAQCVIGVQVFATSTYQRPGILFW